MIGICEYCKKEDDLRPYGAKGEFICFSCGMKDEETTRKMFRQYSDAEIDATGICILGTDDIDDTVKLQ